MKERLHHMLSRLFYDEKLMIYIFQFIADDKTLNGREREKHSGHEFVFCSIDILDFSPDSYHSLAK